MTTVSDPHGPFSGAKSGWVPIVNSQPVSGVQLLCGDLSSKLGLTRSFGPYGESGPTFWRVCMRLSRNLLAKMSL